MSEAMATVAAAVGSVSTIFKTIKDAAAVAQQAKNLELYERVTAVYGDVVGLVEKNRELVDENRLLKEKLSIKGALSFDSGHYWLGKDATKDGPFCQICWDVDSKLVRSGSAFTTPSGLVGHGCEYCGLFRSKSTRR
jgi:hypothetical protein